MILIDGRAVYIFAIYNNDPATTTGINGDIVEKWAIV